MQLIELTINGETRYHTIHSVVLAQDKKDHHARPFVIMTGMANDCRTFIEKARQDTDDRYSYSVVKVD